MRKKIVKALTTLTVLLILLLSPGLSITNCIQQNKSSLTSAKACSRCYHSYLNNFGSCSPYRSDQGCAHSNITFFTSICSTCKPASSYCAICKPAYCLKRDSCILITKNAVPNCVRHIKPDWWPDCLECTNGIPAADLNSCGTFGTATEEEKLYVANCATGRRSSRNDPARCAICDTGYAFETTTEKCVSTTTTGCWTMTNGACTSCRAWDGYFSDSFDESAPGQPVLCKTLDNQAWLIAYVAGDLADVDAGRIAQTPEEILSRTAMRRSNLYDYADFKNGFIVRNMSRGNFITSSPRYASDTIEKSDLGWEIMPDFSFQWDQSYGYFYLRKSELFRCFFEKKM